MIPNSVRSISTLIAMQKTSSSCGSHLSTSLYAQTNTSILWAFIEGLVAMRYFYGMPSFFFTYSPDDINGVLNIKLSLPQTNNQEFPAYGSGLATGTQNGDTTFHSIPVSPHNLRILLVRRTVTAKYVDC